MHYCSSDSFRGSAPPSGDTKGLSFGGSSIVAHAMDFLMDPGVVPELAWVPRLSDASAVIISGGSAGANGVKHNIDGIADALDPIPVVGVSDAAFSPTVARTAADNQRSDLESLDMVQLVLDSSCEAGAADILHCRDGEYVLSEWVDTPMFVAMDQLDGKALGNQGITAACVSRTCTDHCVPRTAPASCRCAS
jgi:hypothetical protein